MSDHYSGGGDKTLAKLVTLEKYVNAYTHIMVDNWSRGDLWYIDTHAGTGKVDMETFGAEVPGSAIRIVRNHRGEFDRFYFYESDQDNFDLIQNTLAEEFDLQFETWETDAGFTVSKSSTPRIMLLMTNSNEGIQWLCKEANSNHHWFVFMDPEAVTDLEANAVEALTDRENSDILINFQTTGAHRAAGWEPSRGSVERLGGGEPVENGDPDDEVEWFCENIEAVSEYETTSRKTVSEASRGHRFDLVFASSNETAIGIMTDIMDKSLKQEIANEIRTYRSEGGQQGLENWWDIKFIEHGADSEAESHRSDAQSGLDDFK